MKLTTVTVLMFIALFIGTGCVNEKTPPCVNTADRCPVFGNSLLMRGGSGIVGYSDCGDSTLNRTSYSYGNYCNGG